MFMPPYRQCARFASLLAVGVETALSLPKALSIALRAFRGTRIEPLLFDSVDQVKRGVSLTDALSPAKHQLPPFFLPVLRAGEENGRLDEALRQKQTVAEALSQPQRILDDDQRMSIASGEIAGKLEDVFDQIAKSTGDSLESKLAWVQYVSLRLTMALVVFGLVGIVQRLILR